jgi:putative PEP-CTERM system histidine kinase
LAALSTESEPVDLDRIEAEWADRLVQANPQAFRKGQNLCMPLRIGDQWLGLLVVSNRVNYVAFGPEDLSLLKTVGDYVGARLYTIRLSDELLASRELEAFQSMSTFFVHDLKNLASTLSLMLKNLARHFDDQAFREDAIKTMSSTVDKINRLIERLALLRESPRLRVHPTDLNELVQRVVSEMEGVMPARPRLTLDLGDSVRIDPEEIEKVVTNLLLNARDASSGGEFIAVTTRCDREYGILSVKDEGLGMSPEYVTESLFRPFHSTKKNGLGIGLFHCKRIVESHGGRIEVESEPGQGSEFRVLLPLSRNEG